MPKYGWRSERFKRMCDAQPIGEALTFIQKAGGGKLKPAAVVEAARDSDSPLHPLFTWDDTEAAERYRRSQASTLIRDIRVIKTSAHGEENKRVYVHVTNGEAGEAGYITIAQASENEMLTTRVLERAMSDLKAWRSRYLELRDTLPELFEAIGEVVD